MKTALDRIPTPALVIALAALMGLLVYGLATRGSSPGGVPMTSATGPTADDASQDDEDSGSKAAAVPGSEASGADDATAAAGSGSDDGSDETASDGAADDAPGAASGAASGPAVPGAAAGKALPGSPLVPNPGSADVITDPGTVNPGNDPRDNASELAAFETRDDTLQSELGEVDAVQPAVDQPGAGSLEADARALAESSRDEYFETQLDELEP